MADAGGAWSKAKRMLNHGKDETHGGARQNHRPRTAEREPRVNTTAGLNPFLISWAHRLFERVGYHLYPAFEKWQLKLLRNARPERELFAWEDIARAYEAWLSDHPECDTRAVAACLATISIGISTSGVFERETQETKDLRTVFQCIWKPMIYDRDTVRREVRLSLGDDLEDD